MRDLLPVIGISLILHILVLSLFALSFSHRGRSPERGPIIVKLLGSPGSSRDQGPGVSAIKKSLEKVSPGSKPEQKTPPAKRPSLSKMVHEKELEPKVTPEEITPSVPEEVPSTKEGLEEQRGASELSTSEEPSEEGGQGIQNENLEQKGQSHGGSLPGNIAGNLTSKDFLPKDLIAQTAQRPFREQRDTEPKITFSTKELKYQSYLNRLKERIETIWVYPRTAIEKGIYGDLIIEFAIKRDGTLLYARVVRTSGFEILDEAAMRALKEGQPYWPLPRSWKEEVLRIRGHFIYTLSGMYIR